MKCVACGHENPLEARFCIACGSPLSGESPRLEDGPSQDESTLVPQDQPESAASGQEVLALQSSVAAIRAELSRFQDRLARVDQRLAELRAGARSSITQVTPAQSVPPPAAAAPETIPIAPSQPFLSTRRWWVARQLARQGAAAAAYAGRRTDARVGAITTPGSAGPSPGTGAAGVAGPPPPFGGLSVDWENVLGRNWFAIIGALALAIGVGFFLKLAFDNDWIGETGRIVLGLVAGLALVGAG